jgi:hypothetical protein
MDSKYLVTLGFAGSRIWDVMMQVDVTNTGVFLIHRRWTSH